jgi:hypothetical protein
VTELCSGQALGDADADNDAADTDAADTADKSNPYMSLQGDTKTRHKLLWNVFSMPYKYGYTLGISA